MPAKPSPASSDRPVFADPTGRRWKLILTFLGLAALLIVVALYLLGHSLLQTPVHARSPGGAPPPAAPLPALPKHPGTVPVFGDGILQEIVVIRHVAGGTVAVDAVGPSAGRVVHDLTPGEARTVGKARLAVERYGAIPTGEIALTFDDGPSTWTPKVLDLLARYRIPATFFVVGQNVGKYPQDVQREVRAGDVIGIHTLTHPDLPKLSDFWIRMQIYLDDHLIRAATHRATLFFRNPYNGNDPASINRDLRAIYDAQKAGYIIVGQNVDTNDWRFETQHVKPVPLAKLLQEPYPKTSQGYLVLLHDGGGDRTQTLAYLEKAIPWALSHGYVFTTLQSALSASANAYSVVTPSVTDHVSFWVARGIFDWVSYVLLALFVFGVGSVVLLNTLFIILASLQEWSARRRVPRAPTVRGRITVAIAAYNEEAVIAQTVESILRSLHPDLEVIVVNDGSTDGTLAVLRGLAALHPQLRIIDKENGGKASALNRAFAEASSDYVVTGDADTIFAPEAIPFLVDHLVRNRDVGAVAGLVRVGNIRGLLTAWQALEYIKAIAVTRTAEHVMGTITVVPGACSVWRRQAVLDAGGYDARTLAEDCELTIRLHQAGWKIEQDNRAVAYTEVPEGLRRLYRQRIRWTYGNVQVVWMHRKMMFRSRYGLLGMFAIPYAVVSILMPVLFLPLLYAVMIGKIASGAGETLLPYVIAFTIADVVVSAVGIVITRSSPSHLLMAPLFRVINEPLRAALLYNTVHWAIKGKVHGWNKLLRTGGVRLGAHARGSPEPDVRPPLLTMRTDERSNPPPGDPAAAPQRSRDARPQSGQDGAGSVPADALGTGAPGGAPRRPDASGTLARRSGGTPESDRREEHRV